jgi:putative heme transporter
MEKRTFDRLDYVYKLLVVIALVIAMVVLAKDIIIPIAFASFLSIVMLPLVKWLESKRFNTVLSILIVLLGFTLTLFLIGWLIIDQIVALVNDLPDIQSKADIFINKVSQWLRDDLSISLSEQNNFLKEGIKTISKYAADLLVSTSNLLSVLVQIPIYIFLFLLYRKKFRIFFERLLPGDDTLVWKGDLEKVLQGYVIGLSLVTLIVAVLNSIGLLLLGIEHAIFFGILSGLLTIIPYVGIFIGASLPALLALVTKDNAWYALGVIIIFSIVQFLEGNFITPKITGSKVSINALAAIIALLIGGKLLGIAGMILAVPAIGVFKILLNESEHLKPFVTLLEDDNGTVTSPAIPASESNKENPDQESEETLP